MLLLESLESEFLLGLEEQVLVERSLELDVLLELGRHQLVAVLHLLRVVLLIGPCLVVQLLHVPRVLLVGQRVRYPLGRHELVVGVVEGRDRGYLLVVDVVGYGLGGAGAHWLERRRLSTLHHRVHLQRGGRVSGGHHALWHQVLLAIHDVLLRLLLLDEGHLSVGFLVVELSEWEGGDVGCMGRVEGPRVFR